MHLENFVMNILHLVEKIVFGVGSLLLDKIRLDALFEIHSILSGNGDADISFHLQTGRGVVDFELVSVPVLEVPLEIHVGDLLGAVVIQTEGTEVVQLAIPVLGDPVLVQEKTREDVQLVARIGLLVQLLHELLFLHLVDDFVLVLVNVDLLVLEGVV